MNSTENQTTALPVPSDEEVAHWLDWNARKLHDPAHAGEQDQRLLKMQVAICTELLERRHKDRASSTRANQ